MVEITVGSHEQTKTSVRVPIDITLTITECCLLSSKFADALRRYEIDFRPVLEEFCKRLHNYHDVYIPVPPSGTLFVGFAKIKRDAVSLFLHETFDIWFDRFDIALILFFYPYSRPSIVALPARVFEEDQELKSVKEQLVNIEKEFLREVQYGETSEDIRNNISKLLCESATELLSTDELYRVNTNYPVVVIREDGVRVFMRVLLSVKYEAISRIRQVKTRLLEAYRSLESHAKKWIEENLGLTNFRIVKLRVYDNGDVLVRLRHSRAPMQILIRHDQMPIEMQGLVQIILSERQRLYDLRDPSVEDEVVNHYVRPIVQKFEEKLKQRLKA